jgi:hypothetical protein
MPREASGSCEQEEAFICLEGQLEVEVEIAELIDRLHEPMSAADRDALWGRYRSSLA